MTQLNSAQPTPEELDGSMLAIQEVFRQARPYILDQAGRSGHTDKLDGSPVTDADMKVETDLLITLTQRYPTVPVYGEETGYGADLPNAFWLIDPIDGTKSFIAGVPAFTSMAVLIENGESVAAVIYNPTTDDMYTARKGEGAYKNETRLDLHSLPLANVALCKGQFVDTLNSMLLPKGISCEIPPEGIGHSFSRVADGKAAARFQLQGRGYTHDYAPGALIIREAGGIIIPVQSAAYTYETRSFVACHPALEATIREHLQAIRDLENVPE